LITILPLGGGFEDGKGKRGVLNIFTDKKDESFGEWGGERGGSSPERAYRKRENNSASPFKTARNVRRGWGWVRRKKKSEGKLKWKRLGDSMRNQ